MSVAECKCLAFFFDAVQRRREGAAFEKDYREVIREQAASGWEFVQAISFDTHADPRIDLVFTRKVKK